MTDPRHKVVTTWICEYCKAINMTFVSMHPACRTSKCRSCEKYNHLADHRDCEEPRGYWTPEVRQRLIRIADLMNQVA